MTNEYLNRAQNFLSKGQVGESIKILKENVRDPDIKNQILILEVRFNSLNSKVIRGTIDSNDARLEENRISNSILFIITNLAKNKNFQQATPSVTTPTTSVAPTKNKVDSKMWIIGLLAFALVSIGTYLFISSNNTADPCAKISCMNGGVCVDGTCDCPDEFTGDRCQTRKSDSTPSTKPEVKPEIKPEVKPAPKEEERPVTPPSVTGKPDLTVKFRVSPNPPTQGKRMRVQGIIKNEGNEDARNIDVEWWATQNVAEPSWTKTISSLKAGKQETISFTYEGYVSWYANITSRLVVDANNRNSESNENNNVYTQTYAVKKKTTISTNPGGVVVVKKPDLKITAFQMNPAIPVKGKKLNMQAVVQNLGNADAGSFEIQWWATQGMAEPSWKKTFSGLAAGKKKVFSFSYSGYKSWYGRITSRLVVDSQNKVQESDERNNIFEKTHAVKKN